MKYQLLNTHYEKSVIERLLEIRNLTGTKDHFFSPTCSNSWNDSHLLNGMETAVNTIISTMKKRGKIIIFGDYDVDGITASWTLWEFFQKFLNYSNVEIKYPNRQKDGYGLRNYHLDEMKQTGAELIITVDNGITSIQEAEYAKQLGLKLIITDHHHPLETLPEAIAIINPLCSPEYPFKYLAGVGVAFKLVTALLNHSTLPKEKKNQIFTYFLPIVAIGTVADIMPLIDENRRIVKQGLHLINYEKEKIPTSLKGFLEFLNLKEPITTYHIGFQIAPRINAGGRIASPKESLQILIKQGNEQLKYLQRLEEINTQRKAMQETMVEISEKKLDFTKKLLIAADEEFHEGIIGLIAGRLTEKYHKPSIVFKIDHEKGTAGASLRGPEYFSVIEMICAHQHLLEKYGGHQGAGGLTVNLEHFEELCQQMASRCENKITEENIEKTILVDTELLTHERNAEIFNKIEKFAPFGEGNPEPRFLFQNLKIKEKKEIGKGERTHIKLLVQFGDQMFRTMFRGKGEEISNIPDTISLIGKIQRDTFNGGRQVIGEEIVPPLS